MLSYSCIGILIYWLSSPCLWIASTRRETRRKSPNSHWTTGGFFYDHNWTCASTRGGQLGSLKGHIGFEILMNWLGRWWRKLTLHTLHLSHLLDLFHVFFTQTVDYLKCCKLRIIKMPPDDFQVNKEVLCRRFLKVGFFFFFHIFYIIQLKYSYNSC